MSAPEVKRGEFLYRDTLFVDLGENKRHPRASASDLKELLLPKKGSAPVKDQVAHCAVDYGRRIWRARRPTPYFQAGDRHEEGIWRVGQEGQGRRQQDTAGSYVDGEKRRASDSGTGHGATISLKIGYVSLEVGLPPSAGKKKQKVETAEAKKRTTPAPKTKATSKPKTVEKQIAKPKAPEKASTAKAPRAKPSTGQPATTAGPPSKPISFNDSPRSKQIARRGKPYLQSPGTHIDMDDAPPAYDSINFSSPPSPPRKMVQISGHYHITLPRLQGANLLAFKIDHGAGQLWGSFRFGNKSGVMRVDELDGIAERHPKSFNWRSRDDGTGQLRFGRGCDGEIEFDGGDGVRGSFYGLMPGGDVDFVARLTDMHDAPDAQELLMSGTIFRDSPMVGIDVELGHSDKRIDP
ncbi:hypothetical protein A1O1_01706 [Capronia coronata CBS 617.96]|uniref:Uncharacterized protein n=1 Tax=Capronia coronata CBS 617.96 TaxID=1182541 RepID=W9ZFM3_9EURO|nr:uncharacterized protein A1O1_01706 [Capronia coronata CBS 617.96]EXJ93314.1 hypothetical protein A1O1_01706 [Capronia coronata CBS 617.96]